MVKTRSIAVLMILVMIVAVALQDFMTAALILSGIWNLRFRSRRVTRQGGETILRVILTRARGPLLFFLAVATCTLVVLSILVAFPGGRRFLRGAMSVPFAILLVVDGFLFWWDLRRTTSLEFREEGITRGDLFWPWAKTWFWGWTDDGVGIWVKSTLRFDVIAIAESDRPAVAAILQERIGSPTLSDRQRARSLASAQAQVAGPSPSVATAIPTRD